MIEKAAQKRFSNLIETWPLGTKRVPVPSNVASVTSASAKIAGKKMRYPIFKLSEIIWRYSCVGLTSTWLSDQLYIDIKPCSLTKF